MSNERSLDSACFLIFRGTASFVTVPGGTTTNRWQRVYVPMNQITPRLDPFSRLDVQTSGNAGNEFYMDDFRLVGGVAR